MRTQQEILTLLAKQKPELEKDFKVRSLALFGSYARGEQQTESDVDILVDVAPSIGLNFVSLAERIEEALGLPVELVSRRAVKPRALEFIENELIYV